MEQAGKETVKGVATAGKQIPVYIMGAGHRVPEGLTIMKAVETAGYQYIRGCGCRGGICGACGTFYRVDGDYHLQTGLACQTVVEPGMMIMQMPFFPVHHPHYHLEQLGKDLHEELRRLFPEVFKCVGCGTCTRTCPMGIDVMDYVALMKRGDLLKAAEQSFNCIMCGLCAIRCPAQISQHTAALFVRRAVGRHLAPHAQHLDRRVQEIRSGQYAPWLAEVKRMSKEQLKHLYVGLEREPDLAEIGAWMPKERNYLISQK